MSRKKQAADTSAVPKTAKPKKQAQPDAEAGLEADTGPQAETPSEADISQLRAELEAARAKAAEDFDKFLRAKAEAENVQRRAQVEIANARKYGIERFAAELLAVRDSLELARTVDIQHENQTALEQMHEGLDLTLKLMDSAFQKFSLTVIDPQGEKFDPEKHQAMSMVESDEVAPGYVVQVVQKGYLLHDRLLRPAMVLVAKAREAEGSGGNT
ncbi:MAG: nucleotide exchange factor GrpE [Gammaproteobacteria bacterium]|nr:nucleotide exchange factor GrpE [Gammaproteobacteria bacterium]